MAKKKKGKGKGKKGKGKDRIKQTITALEKAILLSQIDTLERKIARKRIQIRDLLKEKEAYDEKRHEDYTEKIKIIQKLQPAIKNAIDAKKNNREALAQFEERQNRELQKLEDEFALIQSQIIEDGTIWKAENAILNQKLEALEQFKTEVDIINAKISQAEQDIVEEAGRFKKDINFETRQARFLVLCIREQLMPLLSEKAESFQKKVADSIDLSYISAIKESIRLDDLVKNLTQRVTDIEEENENLDCKLQFLKNDHKVKMEYGRKKTVQYKIQRKLIAIMRKKQQEHEKEITLMKELKTKTVKVAAEVYKLEHNIASIKENLQTLRLKLTENEAVIKKQEQLRSKEKASSKKMVAIVVRAQQFMKDELMQSLDALPEEDLTFLEKMNTLFKKTVDLEEKGPTSEMKFATYKTGDLGILSIKDNSVKSGINQLDTSVQTDESGLTDAVAAIILSDVGLLSKFERRSEQKKT